MEQWLNLGVEDNVFHLEGYYFGMSSGEMWLWISFFSGRFVKELVLGGDVYFSGCCPHGC